jgi:hypothetical protein
MIEARERGYVLEPFVSLIEEKRRERRRRHGRVL